MSLSSPETRVSKGSPVRTFDVERRTVVGTVRIGDGEYPSPVHAAFALCADTLAIADYDRDSLTFAFDGRTFTVDVSPTESE